MCVHIHVLKFIVSINWKTNQFPKKMEFRKCKLSLLAFFVVSSQVHIKSVCLIAPCPGMPSHTPVSHQHMYQFQATASSSLSRPLFLTEFLWNLWSLYYNLSFIRFIQRIFHMPDTLLSSEDVIVNKREVVIKLVRDDYFVNNYNSATQKEKALLRSIE